MYYTVLQLHYKKLHPCWFCNNFIKLRSSISIFLQAVTWMNL